ncbi:hypothetical protein EHO57_14090 [Leptospira langatensis]|uniref:Uncharacterized protein n=1 Tax=Leptospira langatensis TaxID=2484983 RepID=A0A5R2ASX1_9LEPT|nr:hypothetical protein [Leptospira langatensis]TGJ99885.1 hypothetical protein EHO57_14090 [Leptospira langatensis]
MKKIIEKKLQELAKEFPFGKTILIRGKTGAGKTALLEHWVQMASKLSQTYYLPIVDNGLVKEIPREEPLLPKVWMVKEGQLSLEFREDNFLPRVDSFRKDRNSVKEILNGKEYLFTDELFKKVNWQLGDAYRASLQKANFEEFVDYMYDRIGAGKIHWIAATNYQLQDVYPDARPELVRRFEQIFEGRVIEL